MTDYKSLYLSFEGRVSRKDYALLYILPAFVIYGIAYTLDNMMRATPQSFGIFAPIVGLVLLWPSIVMTTKRLHDWDKTGWFQIINIIPIIGMIFWIVTACVRGTEGTNRFGAQPEPIIK